MPQEDETIYDLLLKKLKNNRIISIILILGLTITTIESFTGTLDSLYKKYFVQEYKVPEISTKYYYIRGHGLSMMLRGDLDESIKKSIGGTPIVWKNDVYNELKDLHDKFSRRIGFEDSYLSDDNYQSNLDDKLLEGKMLPSTYYSHDEYGISWEIVKTLPKFPSNLNKGWKLTFVNNPNVENSKENVMNSLSNGELPLENLLIQRTIDRNEAAEIFKIIGDLDFFNYITNKGYPDDFFTVTLKHGSECDGIKWFLSLRTPLLAVQVLVIENLTKEPLTINKAIGKLLKGDGIVANYDELKQVKEFNESLHDLSLGINECLIIPINLVYSERKDLQTETFEKDWNSPLDIDFEHINRIIKNTKTFKFNVYGNVEDSEYDIEISNELLHKLLHQPERKTKKSDYYLISQNIDAIVVNERKLEIRSANAGSIFVSHGNAYGSCPYVFSANGTLLGKFLTGRDSKEREGIYSKSLDKLSNKFTIKELENETTFIKWMRLECQSPDGKKWYLYPKNDLLHIQNEDYVILRKNQSVEVTFDANLNGIECRLQTYGYYVPNK